MRVRRKLASPPTKAVPIEAKKDGTILCPLSSREQDIDECYGCEHKVAFGARPRSVISPPGQKVQDSALTVDCFYFTEMPLNKIESYLLSRDLFYVKEPPYERPKEDIEADSIIDEHNSHLHPHARSEID